LLFKSSTAGMQFLLSSAIAALSSRIDAHTLAGPQRVFAFHQDVVSQASKASPEISNYPPNACIIGDAILPQTGTKLTKKRGFKFGALLWRNLTPQR